MIAEMEIKVKSPLGYSVCYKIWKPFGDCETEKEFVVECQLALVDSLRVAGLNKRNVPGVEV